MSMKQSNESSDDHELTVTANEPMRLLNLKPSCGLSATHLHNKCTCHWQVLAKNFIRAGGGVVPLLSKGATRIKELKVPHSHLKSHCAH